jgi:hypothetical protein
MDTHEGIGQQRIGGTEILTISRTFDYRRSIPAAGRKISQSGNSVRAVGLVVRYLISQPLADAAVMQASVSFRPTVRILFFNRIVFEIEKDDVGDGRIKSISPSPRRTVVIIWAENNEM